LNQFIRIFNFDPILKVPKVEFPLLVIHPQPLEVVIEDLLSVLFLEDTVDEMAAEQLQLYLAPECYILGDLSVGF